MSSRAFIRCLGLITISILTGDAMGQLEVCDESSVSISVAYATSVSGGKMGTFWDSHGWRQLSPGQCSIVYQEILKNEPYYLRAEEVNGNRTWEGMFLVCVSHNKFDISYKSAGLSCPKQNPTLGKIEQRGFLEVDLKGESSYSFSFRCEDCAHPAPSLAHVLKPPSPPPPKQATFMPSLELSNLPQLSVSGEKPDWQKHLDWCKDDTATGGSLNCTDEYFVYYPECVVSGGRSCLMSKAKQSARDNDCDNAFRAAMLCQCHNQGAAEQIQMAGEQAVCQYLGPPTPPQVTYSPPPAQPAPKTPAASPAITQMTFTCVMTINGTNVAWFDGVASAFFDSAGHANRSLIGREVEFSPAAFQNCSGSIENAVPIGKTRITVKSASLCTNLQTGRAYTLINILCP